MGYNIKFSVHRNPQKDSEGNDTYQVGHSTEQTEEQVKMRLDQWFSSHEMLTCRQMMGLFGITRYMANKWLDSLCVTPSPYLYPKKIGGTVCYYRHTKK